MQVIISKDQVAASQRAAQIFADSLTQGAETFGLATGSTPIMTYQNLVQSNLDFSQCVSINLDEYLGINPANDQSYHYFMKEHLFNQKPFAQSYLPNGLASDPDQEVQRYDQIIAHNPIDLQLLGIGRNGHIGFNEPKTSFALTTHVADLTQSTIDANARFFKNIEDVPRKAYSMGIASIMQSKQIILEAFGVDKAQAVQQMIEGPVTEDVPASVLQRHPNVVILLDQAAASLLSK